MIPAHNEGEALDRLITETATAAAETGTVWEIVVVDDGSTDGTAATLGRLQRTVPELLVVRHEQRSGQSAAVVTGVRAASASWIVTLDGDGQNDPADVGDIWRLACRAEAEHSPVLVVGWRRERRDGARRRAVTWLISRWSARMLGHPVLDQGCGIKCFRRDAFLTLPPFDHMHRFLPGLFVALDAQIVSFPVRHHRRAHGSSHYTNLTRVREALIDVLGILWLRRRALRSTLTSQQPRDFGELR